MKGRTPILLFTFCVFAAFTFTSAQVTECNPWLGIGLRGLLRVGNTFPDVDGSFRNWKYKLYNIGMSRVVSPTLTCTMYGSLYNIRITGAEVDVTGRWWRKLGFLWKRRNDFSSSVSGITMDIYTRFTRSGDRIDLDHTSPRCYARINNLDVRLGGKGLIKGIIQGVANRMNAKFREQLQDLLCEQIQPVLRII